MKKLYASLLFLCAFTFANAAAVSSKAVGNWNASTSWSNNAIPTALDDVTIKTTTQTGFCIICAVYYNNITIQLGTNAVAKTVTVNNGLQLDVIGDLTVSGNVSVVGTMYIRAGSTVQINGSLTNSGTIIIEDGATITTNGLLTNTGTMTIGQNVSITGATNFRNNGNFTLGANSSVNASGYFLNDISGNAYIYGAVAAGTYGDNQNYIYAYSGSSISLGTTFYNDVFGAVDLKANTSFACLGAFTNDGAFRTNGILDVTGAAINTDSLKIRSGSVALFRSNFTNDVFGALTIANASFTANGNFLNDQDVLIANNGLFNVGGTVTNGNLDDIVMAGPSGRIHINGGLVNDGYFTAYDSLYIGGAVTNNDYMYIYGTSGFQIGSFTTNYQLELYSGAKGKVNGNFVNTYSVNLANNCELVITGNFSQGNADDLLMDGPNGLLAVNGTLTNTDGDVTLYDTFSCGGFSNSSNGDVIFNNGLISTFTGNMENQGNLTFGTNGGTLIFNMDNNSVFRLLNPAKANTVACTSLIFNGHFYSANDVTISTGKSITVTGDFELHDSPGASTRNVFDLNGSGSFGSITLTNSNLEATAPSSGLFTTDYYRTDLQIANADNVTFSGAITFNNSSWFTDASTFGMSAARVLIQDGTIDIPSQIEFNTGAITGDMSGVTKNIFNALSLETPDAIIVDGQIAFGDPAYTTTRGGNFLILNNSDVNITFTHDQPFLNYQGGLRVDNSYLFSGTDTDADVIFDNNSPKFILPTHNNNTFPDIFIRGSVDTVQVEAQTFTNQIKGTLYIGDDGQDRIILLEDDKNFDGFESSTRGEFKIGLTTAGADAGANCIYMMKDAACENGIPQFASIPASRFSFNNNTIFEYYVSEGLSYDVLGEATRGTYLQYPRVYLTGPGEKVYTAINGSFFLLANNNIDYIELFAGSLTFEANCDFFLTNDYSFGGKFITYDGSTINIEGDFKNAPRANVFLGLNSSERHTNVNYNGVGDQTIYQFYEDGFTNYYNPTIIEEYDILSITNASGICTTGSDIIVGTRLDIGDNATLALDDEIRLLSDASYTAYMGPINDPTSITIDYTGGGNFLVEKYQSYTGYSAPDLSSPILGQTLAELNNAGVEMRGFPGSDKPGNRFSSVSTYTEATDGQVNNGFNKPSDISNPYFATNGSGYITSSAFRVNVDPSTFTLEDEGQVRYGTQTYALTFTNNTASRTADDGYNLIGNPYAAPLDVEAIFADPENAAVTALLPFVYTYQYFDNVDNAYNQGYGAYQAITGAAVGAATNVIPSHASFWVKTYEAAAASGSYLLKIKESHKYNQEASQNLKSKKSKVELAQIKLLTNGKVNDEIYFHFWPKALANSIDKRFDLPRIGEPTANTNSINFVDEYNKSMNLLINAFDQKVAVTTLPILTNITKAGSFTLELNNLQEFIAEFPCAKLLDTETGETYALKAQNTFTFTTNEPFTKARFVLELRKNLEDFMLVEQPLCSYNKGSFSFKAKTSKVEQLILSSSNGFNTSFNTNGTDFKIGNLAADTYTVKNLNGTIGCASNEYSFEIYTPAKILSDLTVSETSINTNTPITLTAEGTAAHYLWDIEDQTYTEAEVTHAFSTSGTHKVMLYASNSDNTCTEEMNKKVEVQELRTGLSSIGDADSNFFSINNGIIVLHNPQEIQELYVYDVSGKLLSTLNTLNSLALPTGTYLIKLKKFSSDFKSFKFVVSL